MMKKALLDAGQIGDVFQVSYDHLSLVVRARSTNLEMNATGIIMRAPA